MLLSLHPGGARPCRRLGQPRGHHTLSRLSLFTCKILIFSHSQIVSRAFRFSDCQSYMSDSHIVRLFTCKIISFSDSHVIIIHMSHCQSCSYSDSQIQILRLSLALSDSQLLLCTCALSDSQLVLRVPAFLACYLFALSQIYFSLWALSICAERHGFFGRQHQSAGGLLPGTGG